jgi:hypothetical protein
VNEIDGRHGAVAERPDELVTSNHARRSAHW